MTDSDTSSTLAQHASTNALNQSQSQSQSTAVVRLATLSDLNALATLGRRTFTETFGHMYTAENLQTYLDGAYSLERIAADLSDSERTAMWIVERDGVAIGYALAGRAVVPHADVTANAIELHRFYLVREEQGAGLGSKLYAQVEQWLNAHVPPNDNSSAFEDVWLGVWSENVAAQRFYARCGFEKVGEYKFKVGDHYDHEFIMRRRRREHD